MADTWRPLVGGPSDALHVGYSFQPFYDTVGICVRNLTPAVLFIRCRYHATAAAAATVGMRFVGVRTEPTIVSSSSAAGHSSSPSHSSPSVVAAPTSPPGSILVVDAAVAANSSSVVAFLAPLPGEGRLTLATCRDAVEVEAATYDGPSAIAAVHEDTMAALEQAQQTSSQLDRWLAQRRSLGESSQ